uniref:Uncharacterized protein n=1 Tax=Peronospora matthiolae TaxID=2874970 RepID=A0AAV1V6X8_9STRA
MSLMRETTRVTSRSSWPIKSHSSPQCAPQVHPRSSFSFVMARKSISTRPCRTISVLVRAKNVAEEEILGTPVLGSIAVSGRGYTSV